MKNSLPSPFIATQAMRSVWFVPYPAPGYLDRHRFRGRRRCWRRSRIRCAGPDADSSPRPEGNAVSCEPVILNMSVDGRTRSGAPVRCPARARSSPRACPARYRVRIVSTGCAPSSISYRQVSWHRKSGPLAPRDRGGMPGRLCRRPARWVRHPRGRARHPPVGRSAAADRDRASPIDLGRLRPHHPGGTGKGRGRSPLTRLPALPNDAAATVTWSVKVRGLR